MIWRFARVVLAIPVAAILAGGVFAFQLMAFGVIDQFIVGLNRMQATGFEPSFFPSVLLGALMLGFLIAVIAGMFFAMGMAISAVPIWFVMDRLGWRGRRAFAAVGATASMIGGAVWSHDTLQNMVEGLEGSGALALLTLALPGAVAGLVLHTLAYLGRPYADGRLKPPPARPS